VHPGHCIVSADEPSGKQNSVPETHAPNLPRVPKASHLPLDADGALLVVSPHLDDAVMSCGELVAAASGVSVMTVFAGRPPDDQPLTDWDRASGFATGDDVIGTRRGEDERALGVLGAHPVWLDYVDAQYGCPAPTAKIAEAMAAEASRRRVAAVVVPLGLFHDDHRQAGDAGATLVGALEGVEWYAYEEALYRTFPGLVQDRLCQLREIGIKATPASGPLEADGLAETKQKAVACYGSQLQALDRADHPGHVDARAPERYWWLTRT
jgi:LmbE family N-acetylglucosaminyl deacetylase